MSTMGEYAHIKIEDLQDAIFDILEEYGETVYIATEEGLDAAEKVLIKNMKAGSPSRTGDFKKKWRGSRRKYKLSRFVHNTKMVKGKKGTIPLTNILEYSSVRGNPFMKKVHEKSINEMAAAVVGTIKRGV